MASGQSVRDEIREERKKLKGKGLKANLEYFWDYYKMHTIVAIGVVILLAILIRDISNNKPYGFYAMMLNTGASEAQTVLEEQFSAYASIDTTQYDCLVDTTSTFSNQTFDEMTVATSQKIMANLSGREMDVMTADIDTFLFYANQETFMDLRSVYTADELAAMKDRLVYVDQSYLDYLNSDEYQTYISTGEFDENNRFAVKADVYNKTLNYREEAPEEMDDPIPVGIRLTGSGILEETGVYAGRDAVAAVIINTQRVELAKKYIEFLMK